ncbi:hypothetical protein ACOSQ2_000449 [Xanthoceras sorbifolium]
MMFNILQTINIVRSQLCPRCPQDLSKNSHLIVLSCFGTGNQHLKLTTIMFQNIFRAIDINTRIVLLNYNKDTKLIDFRHYSIRLQLGGVSRRLRKFVQNHQVPDLRSLQDVSDFVTRVGYGSDSEGGDEAATVTLTSRPGGGPGRAGRSPWASLNRGAPPCPIILVELIGLRQKVLLSFRRLDQKMTLQLVKVEDGLCSHSVIFNEYVYMLTVILLSFLLCPFLNFDELRKTSASSRPIDDKKKDDKEPKNQQDDEESEEDIEDEED